MNLRWKSLERRLKRQVRAEVRASAALRQEYKHAHRGRRWWNIRLTPSPNVYRVIFWFAALNFLGRNVMSVELILAFIWLWAMAAALWRTAQLQSTLYFAPELNLFNHLPISDRDIFQVLWRKFLRNSIWPVIDFTVLYGALAYRLGAGWQSPLAGLLLGGLQGIFNVGIAASLLSLGLRRWLPMSALMLYIAAIGVMFFGNSLPGLVSGLNHAAYWIPPAGWVHYALGLSFSQSVASDWVPCLVAGVVLAGYPIGRQRMHRRYLLNEASFAQAFRLTATGEAAALRLKEYGAQFAQSPQDVSASVRTGAFLDQLDWRKAGFVEKVVSRFLNPREKNIAEFLTAARPGWTKSLRTMVFAGVALLIMAKVFSMQFFSGFGFMIFIMVFLTMGGGNQSWRGFGPSTPVGFPPPLYSFYPLSFAEIHRTILKIMLVRYFLFLPLLAGTAYLFMHSLRLNSHEAMKYGIKVILVGLAAQPLLAIIPFSAASNDSDRFRFAIPALIYSLLILGCGGGFIFVDDLFASLLLGFMGVLLCWGGVRLYQRRFDQNKFDLLPTPKSTAATPLVRG